MKLLLACVLVSVASCEFVEFLQSIQNHHSFSRLPQDEKLLFGELVVAAEEGPDQLSAFIDRVGFVKVIGLVDDLSQYDAQKFEAYLAEHLNYTHHAPGNENVVHKRADGDGGNGGDVRPTQAQTDPNWVAFSNYLDSLEGSYYDSLPEQEKQTWYGLKNAADSGALKAYIASVGYGPVFGLMEALDYRHANDLYDLLEKALGTDTVSAVGKRDNDNDNFHSYLNSLHSQYYQHLPEQERQTYNDLMAAAQHNQLTCYTNTVGFGPVFGLMEHLDYTHANALYELMTTHLNTEQAICA